MVFELAAYATIAFSFAGGGDSFLVETVSRAGKSPICLLAEPNRQWKAMEFTAKNAGDLIGKVRQRTKLSAKTPLSGGLFAPAYSEGYFIKNKRFQRVAQFGEAPTENLVGPKFTFETKKGRPYSLDQLRKSTKADFSWHWFFDDARLYISGELDHKELLTAIADALGAKVVKANGSTLLDLDPKEMKSRVIAMAAPIAWNSENLSEVRILYTAAVFEILTEAQIKAAYKDLDELQMFPIPSTSTAYALAQRKLQIRLYGKGTSGEIQDRLRQEIDESGEMRVQISPATGAMTQYRMKPGSSSKFFVD